MNPDRCAYCSDRGAILFITGCIREQHVVTFWLCMDDTNRMNLMHRKGAVWTCADCTGPITDYIWLEKTYSRWIAHCSWE